MNAHLAGEVDLAGRVNLAGRVTLPGQWLPGSRFAKIREFIELIAAIRGLTEPITSAAGLRAAIELVVRFAALIGIDPDWVNRLQEALDDDGIFRVVLAVVQYALGLMDGQLDDESDGTTVVLASEEGTCVVTTQSFLSWLPIVLQLIQLIRGLRGE